MNSARSPPGVAHFGDVAAVEPVDLLHPGKELLRFSTARIGPHSNSKEQLRSGCPRGDAVHDALIAEPFDLVILEGEKVAIQIGKPRTLPGLTERVRDQRSMDLERYTTDAIGYSFTV